MDDELPSQQPPSVLTKYAGEHKDPDGINTHACFSSHATDLRMLDVRMADGSHVGLPYHYVTRITLRTPEDLRLEFGTCRVMVKGRRLDPVYQALLFNRVGYIAVSTASPAMSALSEDALAAEPCISSISLTAPDEEQ